MVSSLSLILFLSSLISNILSKVEEFLKESSSSDIKESALFLLLFLNFKNNHNNRLMIKSDVNPNNKINSEWWFILKFNNAWNSTFRPKISSFKNFDKFIIKI